MTDYDESGEGGLDLSGLAPDISEECNTHIALLTLELHIPQAQSLKSKRSVLKSLKDRIRTKFNVSFAELGAHDKWQRSICAAVMVGNDKNHLNRTLQSLVELVSSSPGAQLVASRIEFL